MGGHDAFGESLCVHSVVVAPACRRLGIATAALKAYLETVRGTQPQASPAQAPPRAIACPNL